MIGVEERDLPPPDSANIYLIPVTVEECNCEKDTEAVVQVDLIPLIRCHHEVVGDVDCSRSSGHDEVHILVNRRYVEGSSEEDNCSPSEEDGGQDGDREKNRRRSLVYEGVFNPGS